MGKKKTWLSIVLWIVVCFHLSAQSNNRSIRQQFVDSLSTDIGVRELTGNNDGARVEQYLASVGLGKGYAWCAAFITYHYSPYGTPPKYSARARAWFPLEKLIKASEAQKGDLVGFYYSKLGRIGHIGAIEKDPIGNIVYTIEGNTTGGISPSGEVVREGGGVYRKRRMRFQISHYSSWFDKEEKKSILDRRRTDEDERKTNIHLLDYRVSGCVNANTN